MPDIARHRQMMKEVHAQMERTTSPYRRRDLEKYYRRLNAEYMEALDHMRNTQKPKNGGV